MKLPLLTPLSVLLLAVSASAVTLDAPAAAPAAMPAAQDLFGADLERKLGGLERDENAAKLELAELARESGLLRSRTLARGRAYTRLARAGLLPIGGGFTAFV